MNTPAFTAVCLLTTVSSLVADEAKALSPSGGHRLCLKSVEQVTSPWDEKIHALSLRFVLEHSKDGKTFTAQPPENVFLEAVGPLDEVILPSGENVASRRHSAWTDERSSEVVVHTLEVGEEQRQLRKLKLTLTLAKVTEWQVLEFKDLKQGKNETLHCGPFEIDCDGEAEQFVMSAASRSEFSQEHENWRKQMPLDFINHRYAIHHGLITDSRGRVPGSSTVLGTGGSTTGIFSFQQLASLGDKTAGDSPQLSALQALQQAKEPIAYPVTLQLKLPKKYETERVSFEFENLTLPPLQKLKKQ